MDSFHCSVKGQAEVLNKSILYYPKTYAEKKYQYQIDRSQVLGKYKISEINLPLTLEITSHADCEAVI